MVARVIEPPRGPVDGLLSPLGLRVNHLLSVEQGPVRGQAFAVAGAFDDDPVATGIQSSEQWMNLRGNSLSRVTVPTASQ